MNKDKTRFGGWMTTRSGRKFWPLDPRPEEIDFLDIAHALGNICRWGGHVSRFYSVAQHCVLVSRWLRAQGRSKQERLWGLVHDSAESFVGDCVRPIKHFIPQFNKAEDALLAMIVAKLGLPPAMPEWVHRADNVILACEARDLMRDENGFYDMPEEPDPSVVIEKWDPPRATCEWRRELAALTDGAHGASKCPGCVAGVVHMAGMAPEEGPECRRCGGTGVVYEG